MSWTVGRLREQSECVPRNLTTMRRRPQWSGSSRYSSMPPPDASVASSAKPVFRTKPRQQQPQRPSPVRRPLPDDVRPTGQPRRVSIEETERIRKLHEENRAKAAEAGRRQREKQMEKEQERRRMEQEHRNSMLEQQRLAAASLGPSALQHKAVGPSQQPPSRKRKEPSQYTSPHTAQPPLPKRRSTTATCRMVWRQDGAFGPSKDTRDSYVDIALKEGTPVVYTPPVNFAANAVRDGLTIVMYDGAFRTMQGDDPWFASYPWGAMTSKLVCKENSGNMKIDIVSDGGLGLKRIGSGTFNLVVDPVPQVLPEWLKDKDVVYRITRPDSEGSGVTSDKSYKYQTLSTVTAEAENAMFASANMIGVGVHAIASYHGVRQGRTLRYGTVYALERADADLFRALERCQTFDGGALIAVQVTELLFKASRCGVAFFDIKPANILRMATRNGQGGFFRLTDYDPAFFIRLPDQDWRTLLLLNLALLAAHVRNQTFASTNGFCAAVAPVLRQLVRRRREFYKSDWLFDARSVRVGFELPENHGDFQMQRIFAVMSTSYFYREDLKTTPSAKYRWEFKDQSLLDSYWRTPKNRYSWPPQWTGRGFKPLIEQLVDFALTESK